MSNQNLTKIFDTLSSVTKTEFKLLIALEGTDDKNERHAYEMIKMSNGDLKIGSIYRLLGRLTTKKMVESRKELSNEYNETRPPRRLYKLTPLGSRMLTAYREVQESLSSHQK